MKCRVTVCQFCVAELRPLASSSVLSSYFFHYNSNLGDKPTVIKATVMDVCRVCANYDAGLILGAFSIFFVEKSPKFYTEPSYNDLEEPSN